MGLFKYEKDGFARRITVLGVKFSWKVKEKYYKRYDTKMFAQRILSNFFSIVRGDFKKRILLVDPQNDFYEKSTPIAILDLAQYLREHGLEVDVCKYPYLPSLKYDLIGVSCIGTYEDTIFDQLKTIKKKYKNIPIEVGGKWTTAMTPEEENELKALGIKVAYGKGELLYTDEKEIDFEKYPSWNKKDYETLCENSNNYAMTSRGCPFHCNFCNNTENKISYFSAKRSVDNIELVLNKKGNVFFVDDVFVTNYDHAFEIYNECKKRGIKIEGKNSFFVHLNAVNDKTLELIDLYKPKYIEVGIESGSDFILEKMNKRTSKKKIREIVPILAQHTKVHGLWLVGYPYENEETLNESYELLKELQDYLESNWVSFYMPLYSTVGHKMAHEYGGTFYPNKSNHDVQYIPKGLPEETLRKVRRAMLDVKGCECA